jgi:sarcosine oxidase subunit delta
LILLTCPNCGARNVSEFRYGGEATKRPNVNTTTRAEWSEYLYMRKNAQGIVREWWYHRAGCECWFLAERNTKTHDVIATYLWSPKA